MEQLLLGVYSGSGPSNAGLTYNGLVGGSAWNFTLTNAEAIVSVPGIIKNLRVLLNGIPGAGKWWDFHLMVNGVATALSVLINNPDTSGSNLVNEVAVAAGDTVCIRAEPTDGVTNSQIVHWTTKFVSANRAQSLILGTNADTLNNAATEYCGIMGWAQNLNATEDFMRQVCPTGGTFKNFYVKLSADPGIDPDGYEFTLRVNMADSDDGEGNPLQVTITADATTGNDTTHEIPVVAGNILTMKIVPLNGPLATPKFFWGMCFVPDRDGESILIGGNPGLQPDIDVTEYNRIVSTAGASWFPAASEVQVSTIGEACTLEKLHVLLWPAPGAGDSYDFTVRINAVDGNVTLHIHDADTTGDSGALSDAVSDDDLIALECDPTGSPNLTWPYFGLVSFIEPPPIILTDKSANMANKMVAAGLI